MNPKQQKGHWTFFCINTFFIDQYSRIYPYFRIMCSLSSILTKIGEDILENKDKYQSDIDELLAMYAETIPTRIDYASDIKKLTADKTKIEAKKDKILELYTDDDISKDEYLETKNKLNAELEKLSQKIEALRKEQSDLSEQTFLLKEVRRKLGDIQRSRQSALEVAQNMLKEITVLRESTEKCVKLRIDMKFPKTEQVYIIKPFILYGDTEHLTYKMKMGIKSGKKYQDYEIDYRMLCDYQCLSRQIAGFFVRAGR